MGILAINAGSSSIKCAYFQRIEDELSNRGSFSCQDIHTAPKTEFVLDGAVKSHSKLPKAENPYDGFLALVIGCLNTNDCDISAVGHRVVHGGNTHTQPTVVTDKVVSSLWELASLAPLHQPVNLRLVDTMSSYLPDVQQVACFDTMFHQAIPEVERCYALPKSLTAQGIYAYGFHGLSYEYVFRTLSQLDPSIAHERVVIAHLGAGASLCGVKEGVSVVTTMGFSPADGLPMATRCGRIDPGVLLYLLKEKSLTTCELEDLLFRQSGLLGMSGTSGSMKALRAENSLDAKHAIDTFVYRTASEIGYLAAAMQGIDRLVFTGGIGENDPLTRAGIVTRCGWLGFELDKPANLKNLSTISDAKSSGGLHVIPTDEESMIAEHTAQALDAC
ncbi:MAG: acetate/propionate family kinase [Pseudomonadota bacterium]